MDVDCIHNILQLNLHTVIEKLQWCYTSFSYGTSSQGGKGSAYGTSKGGMNTGSPL